MLPLFFINTRYLRKIITIHCNFLVIRVTFSNVTSSSSDLANIMEYNSPDFAVLSYRRIRETSIVTFCEKQKNVLFQKCTYIHVAMQQESRLFHTRNKTSPAAWFLRVTSFAITLGNSVLL